MLQQIRRIALPAGLAAVGILMAGILAACRPVQVAPAPGLEAAVEPPAAGVATPAGDLVTLTVSKAGDKSTLGVQDGILWLDIESPSGIGTASVTWTVTPTTPVVLRLHLGGLEELRLVNGDVETVASVSSTPPHPVSQSTRTGTDAQLQPIAEGDPAWLDISWSTGESEGAVEGATAAAAAFPLKNGYFDIVLSDPRLTAPGTSLEIRWIDFYR